MPPQRHEQWMLAAQLPVIPPDETPGLVGVRELTYAERQQTQTDMQFLTSLAGWDAYDRCMAAVESLQDMCHALVQHGDMGALSRRASEQLRRVLAVIGDAFTSFSDETARAPDVSTADKAQDRLQAEHAAMLADEDFGLTCQLAEAPVETVVLVKGELRGQPVGELALGVSAMRGWPAAAGYSAPAGLGLVGLSERALYALQRVAAAWFRTQYEAVPRRVCA